MKKVESLKIQIYLFLMVLVAGYSLCAVINLIEKIALSLPVPVLIISFCYLMYKGLRSEIDG